MITVTSENDRINVDVVTMEQSVAGGRIGVSAVIEEVDGTKSYWALAHAPGPPDFHNPACFAHHLPPFEPE